MERNLKIYRLTWSPAKGVHWLAMRDCREQDAESWLAVFRSDEPGVTFISAKRAPRLKPEDSASARQVTA